VDHPFPLHMQAQSHTVAQARGQRDPQQTVCHRSLEIPDRYTTSAKEVAGTFSSRLNTIFRECVTGFDYSQNLMVIKTLPGLAGAAASAIDGMNMSVVLGTLAGDDTVLVVMRDNNAAAVFYGEIKNLLN